MLYLFVNWFFTALGLLLLSYLAPGFRILGFDSAAIAVTAVGLFAAVMGLLMREVASPFVLIAGGAFFILLNAIVFRISALLVPGYGMSGFTPAFTGAVVALVVQVALRVIPSKGGSLESEESWLHL